MSWKCFFIIIFFLHVKQHERKIIKRLYFKIHSFYYNFANQVQAERYKWDSVYVEFIRSGKQI